ncbi:MAG: DUF86 domain-containing protein [Myxococcota bacterium]
MVDADVITLKLGELARRIARVDEHYLPAAPAFPANQDSQEIIAFNLMLSVQVCADIASHIISDEGWPPAATLAEGFKRLAEHGVITEALAQTLSQAVGLRNVVAHGYARINLQHLHAAAARGVEDLREYTRQVAQWVSARTSGS